MPEIVGDLVVQITGDFSGLQEDVNQATSIAADGAGEIQSSFNQAASSATTWSDALSTVSDQLIAGTRTARELVSGINEIVSSQLKDSLMDDAESAGRLGQALRDASGGLGNLTTQVGSAGSAAADASEQLGLFSKAEVDAVSGANDLTKALETLPLADEAGQMNLFSTATQAATEAVGGLTTSVGGGTAPLTSLSTAAQLVVDKQRDLQTSAVEAKATLDELTAAYNRGEASASAVARASGDYEAALQKANPTTRESGEAAHEAESGFGEMAEKLIALGEALAVTEVLKEFVSEALSAYSAVQQFSASMEALTGSAEASKEVLEEIEGIAATKPFSFGELAGAAQKMAAFGLEAEKIPEVLTAAGDASRATGNSFDAIAGALAKIELNGQVTGRQLVQLGVSWKDLAASMGTSISEAQDRLKKGGQDAQKDLEDVLAAVEAKFGQFSQVPLSIGQQFTVLENQMHQVFAGIGAAIAPVATQLVAGLGAVLDILKSVTEHFNALPDPIRNTIVVLGLAAAAIVPLTAAAGGFGLALMGVQAGTKILAELLGQLGIAEGENAVAAEADAVAHGHLAAAEGAAALASKGAGGAAGEAAIAAGGLATKAEAAAVGLTSAETAATGFAGAMGVAGLAAVTFSAAIGVTLANIDDLKKKWDDAVEEMRKKQILEAIDEGETRAGLQRLGFSLEQIGDAVGDLGTKIDKTKVSFDDFGIKVSVVGGEAKDTYEGLMHLAEVTEAVYEKTNNAKKALDDAKDALKGVKDASDGTTAAQEAIAAATKNVDDKFKAYQGTLGKTTAEVKTHVLSLSDLEAANVKLNTALTTAQGVYDQVTARVKAGSGEYNLQSEALKQLEGIRKQLGTTETDSARITEQLEQKTQALIDKTFAQVKAAEDLDDEYGAGDVVVQNAMKVRDGLLGQLGLTIDQFEALKEKLGDEGAAHELLNGHIQSNSDAYKTLGITSADVYKKMADDSKEAADRIQADDKATEAEKRAAIEASITANKKYSDSLNSLSLDFKALGIKSSQSLKDIYDAGKRAFEDLATQAGKSAGDIVRSMDALRDKNREYVDSLGVVGDAFKKLGLVSSEQLKRIAEDADVAAQRVSGLGADSARAADVARDAWKKYYDSLTYIPPAEKAIGDAATSTGKVVKSAFEMGTAGIDGSVYALNKYTNTIDLSWKVVAKQAIGEVGDAFDNLATEIARTDKALADFVKGAGSFKPGSGTSAAAPAGTFSPGGVPQSNTPIMSGDLGSQSYDQLWEDYTRNVGSVSPAAKQLAQMEYQELQRRWAKGESGTGAAGSAADPKIPQVPTSTGAPSAGASSGASSGSSSSAVGVGLKTGPLGSIPAGTKMVIDPGTGMSMSVDEYNAKYGVGGGPSAEQLSAIAPNSLGGTAGGPSATAGVANLQDLTKLTISGSSGASAGMGMIGGASLSKLPESISSAPSFSLGTVPNLVPAGGTAPVSGSMTQMPSVKMDFGLPAGGGSPPQGLTEKPSGWTDEQWAAYQSGGSQGLMGILNAPKPVAKPVDQTIDASKQQWFGGMGPGSNIGATAIPTASGNGVMSLAEIQAALGIKATATPEAVPEVAPPVPAVPEETIKAAAAQAAEAAVTVAPEIPAEMQPAAIAAKAVANAATISTGDTSLIGTAPTLSGAPSSTASMGSSDLMQLAQIGAQQLTVQQNILQAILSKTGSTNAPETGNVYSAGIGGVPSSKQVHVTINNPQVSNQSDIDRMVAQIQNAGMSQN